MTLLGEDLGGEVVRCSTHGAWSRVFSEAGQPEVADLDLHILGQEHVAQLEVAVEEARLVDVASAHQDLLHVVPGLRLGDGTPVLENVQEGLLGAVLQEDVHKVLVFKGMENFDNVAVVHSFVDFYFLLDLLFGIDTFFEDCFTDHFIGEANFAGRLQLSNFVHSGKAAHPEEVFLHVNFLTRSVFKVVF